MPEHRYSIGVDLGTTNSAVAYVDFAAAADASGDRPIQIFRIPQLVEPGEIGQRDMLPSFLYLPGAYDLPAGSTELPWDFDRVDVVGELAREQGARIPGRLVSSAKSWLSYGAVDRTAPILPWGAKDDVPKVSPVEASTRYLRHIREAWDAEMARGVDEWTFAQQLIVLTVPASFDEVARELTVEAAHAAGIPRVILVEEPLAAFYSWLSEHADDWQTGMQDGQLILIADVGGGTTDLTMIGVRSGESGLRFDRLAVGEHLMLGGDNMDITLARYVETQLFGQPGKLDAQRWPQLVYQCRAAKEALLGGTAEAVDITLVGGGTSVIGGTIKAQLHREDVRRLILDGFYPDVALDDQPERRRAGLTELGLPYVQDPAITRHMAAFWRRYENFLRSETGRSVVYPDFLLFNGGTLIPQSVRSRLQNVVQHWFAPVAESGWTPQELPNPHPELAVALGAAYYGLVRLGEGVRVGSGSPRAYYVGVVANGVGQEGITAVCVVPRGTEEGFETPLREPAFTALTNQPVAFQLYTSSTRLGDKLGDVVQLLPEETSALPPIRTVLRYGKGVVRDIPVQLAVRLTAIGTLEVWAQSVQSEHRWQLQFDLRQDAGPVVPSMDVEETIDQTAVAAAQTIIQSTFMERSAEHPPEALRRNLEDLLGVGRNRWPTTLIRQLADTLLECEAGRSRSPEYEKRWLNLLGFCLRPGFGDPADDFRMGQVWKLYLRGLAFPKDMQCRNEWWVFWRRVAGGIATAKQTQIYGQVWPYLRAGRLAKQKPNPMFPKHLKPGEDIEVWMTIASFEQLQASTKVDIGRQLLAKFRKTPPSSRELWALSRVGSRRLVYGPLDRVVPSDEAVEWIDKLLALGLERNENAAYCLVLLAQRTGDRARDVPDETRERVCCLVAWGAGCRAINDLLVNAELTRSE